MNLYLAGQRLNEVLGELSLSKSRGEAAATISAVLITAAADTFFPGLTLALGDGVTLADDSGTCFSGGVQEVRRTPETVSFTAYDRGIYLTRNELYGVFSGSAWTPPQASTPSLPPPATPPMTSSAGPWGRSGRLPWTGNACASGERRPPP